MSVIFVVLQEKIAKHRAETRAK